MELTEEKKVQILKACLASLNAQGFKVGSKAAEKWEYAYFIGVNSVFAVIADRDAQEVALPPYWAMLIMSGRSIVADFLKKVNGKK